MDQRDQSGALPEFLRIPGSAMAREIAAKDWAATTLGPIAGWPVALKTTIATMLSCPMPMYLAWGEELLSFYNDAYRPILGYRAPEALGTPFEVLWADLWDDIGPLVAATLRGEPQLLTDMPLNLSREHVPEESYWTFSYSPAFDDAGRIAGLFCVTGETTARVVAERERRGADERLNLALSAGQGIGTWDWDVVNDLVTADARFARLYGVEPEAAAKGAPIAEFFKGIHPEDAPRLREEIGRVLETGGVLELEYRLRRADGSYRWVSAQGQCVMEDGRCIRLPGVSFDITARIRAEARLRKASDDREFILDLIARQRDMSGPDAILRASSEAIGRRHGVNRVGFYRVVGPNMLRHSGAWSDGRLLPLVGEQPADAFGIFAGDERRRGHVLVFGDAREDEGGRLAAYAEDGVLAGICVPLHSEGRWAAGIYLHQGSVRRWLAEEVALVKEIVQHTWLAVERAEALARLAQRVDLQDATLARQSDVLREESGRREAAEDQVRQLQKMEAVGQLTGGIAHDFNNMLAVVIGGLNLTQRRLLRGDTNVREFIDGAMEGANRAAALTQRLLAFSRQQPLAPEVIDANRLVGGLTDLLTRSLGEAVALETVLGAGLWKARVDPNQLENAIVNLAVNARDAMPDGGRVTVETANAHVDDDYAREAEIDAGHYVMICVTDNGTGMTEEVRDKAFEPFFTTKGVGKGTGLGLSQVFGFIRQSGGHVRIYSELGHGTTVKLYLPRAWAVETQPRLRRDVAVKGGEAHEVILVVEDDERVRRFSVASLRELGYGVLQAGGGQEALEILAREPGITLLLTDVVMPEMTGRQLADKALVIRPDLKVIYTTGYTRNAVVHNGVLDPGTNFLPKPFSLDQLALKVREVLDGQG